MDQIGCEWQWWFKRHGLTYSTWLISTPWRHYIASRQRLRSATRHQLNVPRHYCTRFGCRAFSVAGTRAWNHLPDHLCDPSLTFSSIFFRSEYWRHSSSQRTATRSAVEAFLHNALYRLTIIIIHMVLSVGVFSTSMPKPTCILISCESEVAFVPVAFMHDLACRTISASAELVFSSLLYFTYSASNFVHAVISKRF